MRSAWREFTNAWSVLDTRARRAGLSAVLLATIASLLDGFGLGIVLIVLRIALNPEILDRYPATHHFLNTWGLQDRGTMIVVLFAWVAIFYFIKAGFGIFAGWHAKEFIWNERDRLTNNLIARFLRWDYWRLYDISASVLQKNIQAVEHFSKYFLTPVIMLFSEATAMLVIAIILLLIQPLLTLGILILAAVSVATWQFARRYTRNREAEYEKTVAETLALANEIFGSVRDIKLYNTAPFFLAEVDRLIGKDSDIQKRVTFALDLPRFVLETVLVLALCAATIGLILSGQDITIFLPAAMTLMIGMIRLLPAANRLLLALNMLRFGMSALSSVHGALAVELEAEEPDAYPALPFLSRLATKALGFTYPGFEQPVLNDVTIEIGRGQIIGFVGASGSGKTTLATLLLGLLRPTRGDILVDGRTLGADSAGWRARVAFVPQDVFLLDDTLRRNIAFGQLETEIDDAAIARAVQLAHLEDVVSELPEGLDTRIGDRGGRLSGGQRLRTAIARALYFGRDVLVLDEATSALDPRTERHITSAIEGLRGKITVLIIAHRMSTVERCDRLYVFQEGHVVASGTYDMLARTSPEFRSLIGAPAGLLIDAEPQLGTS